MQLNLLSVRPRQVSFTHGGCHQPCCRCVSPFKDTFIYLKGRGFSKTSDLPPPTVFTAEVRQSHILQRDLLQEAWTLAARVTRHNLPAPQPIAEPGQSAVTVEGVGQEVTERRKAVVKAQKDETCD